MKIVVTGATGFVGHNLIDHLLKNEQYQITALSRRPLTTDHPRLKWVEADLYSLLDCEKALRDCDCAIYLVHSMLPSSRLAQGQFQDFDFLLADNFAKAAEKMNVGRIIYVSGLIPKDKELSPHLASRLEVEKTLNQNSVPVFTLRCGLVIGKSGSSFDIVDKLVSRLPVMGLPSWTHTSLQVVYIKDLVKIIEKCFHVDSKLQNHYDVGAPESLKYAELLTKVAAIKNTKNLFVPVPFLSTHFSKLWVRLVSGISKRLIYPLIDSLVHPMLVSKSQKLPDSLSVEYTSVDQALKNSLTTDTYPTLPMQRQQKKGPRFSVVQSVQRMVTPYDWTSRDLAQAYMRWLPKFLFPFFRILKNGDFLEFYFYGIRRALLILEFSEERTFEGRELFYIRGGLLTKPCRGARMEFRQAPHKDFMIAAIHRFRPRLPWFVYVATQAQLHRLVMWRFGAWLRTRAKSSNPSLDDERSHASEKVTAPIDNNIQK